jgi:hypothetical protein
MLESSVPCDDFTLDRIGNRPVLARRTPSFVFRHSCVHVLLHAVSRVASVTE